MGDIAMSARSHQEPLSAWKDQVCSLMAPANWLLNITCGGACWAEEFLV